MIEIIVLKNEATPKSSAITDVVTYPDLKEQRKLLESIPSIGHGTSVNKPGRLSKHGNIRLRTVFYMPAMAAIRSNPFLISLAKRMEKQGKSRMSIIGASMRKLVLLAYGVLKNQQPFDPNYLDNVPDIA